MNALASHFRGKTVLVTGHTGFKGGWLATWLKHLGAQVVGFSLAPDQPDFFKTAEVGSGMMSVLGDVRNPSEIAATCETHAPEVVFHLAAQSLVRRSYSEPLTTYATNVMGTVHLLEAVRRTPSVRVVIVVTSDKCYENREWVYAYRENDPMGGYDPYSSSKGAAELVTSSYRDSFFSPEGIDRHGVCVASARAGNVIGGGDWGADRLVPDCIRAIAAGQTIPVRNPDSVRPWQHVLEPLSGYLWLAVRMWQEPARYSGAWNFGPHLQSSVSVHSLVEQLIAECGFGKWEVQKRDDDPHEAGILRLDCAKAASLLGWKPVWSVEESVRETVAWYRGFLLDPGFDAPAFTVEQIERYTRAAREADVPWARQADSARRAQGRSPRPRRADQVAAPDASSGSTPDAGTVPSRAIQRRWS